MIRCPKCGSEVHFDDNWGGTPVFRDQYTQLSHRCPSIYSHNLTGIFVFPDDPTDMLCEDHGVRLYNFHCPYEGCKTRSRIKRRYYDELKSRGQLNTKTK